MANKGTHRGGRIWEGRGAKILVKHNVNPGKKKSLEI